MKRILILILSLVCSYFAYSIDIVDIQTPGAGSDSSLYKGSIVSTSGIVTAIKSGTGYWIQNQSGGPYSGIYIYDAVNIPNIGDEVSITGEVDEYFGLTEIKNVSVFAVNSSSNNFDITPISTSAMNDEQWEGVMVYLSNADCNSGPDGFGEWTVNDGSGDAQVDDFLYPYNAIVSETYSIIGVVHYSFGAFKLLPRNKSDIQFFLSISDVQTPGAGSDSSLYNRDTIGLRGVVTAIGTLGYWIQQGGGAFSGIYIFDNINSPSIGDMVDLFGIVEEYNTVTELKDISIYNVLSTGNALSLSTLSTNDCNDEMYEGVYVKVNNATCNTSPNGFGEWIVNDGSGDLVIDDPLFSYGATIGTEYDVTGVIGFTFGDYKLYPRFANDIDSNVVVSNPVVSIVDIQTPGAGSDSSLYKGDTVITNGIVTAVSGNGYWIQDAAGGAYSGVLVFDAVNVPSIGDDVTVEGEVDEYFGLTEIKNVSSFSVNSSGNAFVTTSLSTNAVNDEMWEGVMVSVSVAECVADTNNFNEWIVNDGSGDLQVDDNLYFYDPVVGTDYEVRGVVGYSFGSYELLPRFMADVMETPVTPIVSIVDIQTPGAGSDSSLYKGDTVITNGIVTAVSSGNGYWLQEAAGGAYSGIYVFDGVNSPVIGDDVTITAAVDEYFGLTEMVDVSSFVINSNGNGYVTTQLSTSAVNDEMWEGVMVSVSNATCNAIPNGFGEWFVNDGSGDLQIDDPLFPYGATLNTVYDVTGVVGFGFGEYELFPRFAQDIDSAGVNPNGPDTLTLTISQIQTPVGAGGDSPYLDSTIETTGIVTAVKSGTGYWIQEAAGGAYSGVYVFDASNAPNIGDEVTIIADVTEYFGLTELENIVSYNVNSTGNAFVTTSLSTSAVNDEMYESVMVSVTNSTCNQATDGFGEWIVNDGSGDVYADDFIYYYGATFGTIYDVTGVVYYSFGNYKVLPRMALDIDSSGVNPNPIGDTLKLTISEIQTPNAGGDSPYLDSIVQTAGIVTAVKSGSGYWLQESAGGPYSGVYIFDGINTPNEGDSVVVMGTVDEYFGLTEIFNVTSYSVESSGNAYVISDLLTNDVNDEQWEGVMVKVANTNCSVDSNSFGEWYVNDGSGDVQIDDAMYGYDPVVDTSYHYDVTGVVGYGFGEYEILPRYAADIVLDTTSSGNPGDTNSIFTQEKLVLKAYPNPTSSKLNVELASTDNAVISVIDLSGRTINSIRTSSINNSISVEMLNAGVYFLEVRTGETVDRIRFVKQ